MFVFRVVCGILDVGILVCVGDGFCLGLWEILVWLCFMVLGVGVIWFF